jgi:hypothetical protein
VTSLAAVRERVDRWIFESHPATPESLSLFRIGYAVYVLAIAMPYATWVSGMPDAVWDPPSGPLQLASGFPPAAFLHAATLLLSVSLFALLLGYRTRVASLATGALLVLVIGFEFCFGKIDHNRHLMMVVPVALAGSRWGARYSVDAARGERSPADGSWTLAWLALWIGLYFMTGGAAKIAGGWLRLDTHATQYYVARAGSLAPDALPGPVWELADWGAVAFETGFLLAIASLRTTRIACCLAILFHVAMLGWVRIQFAEMVVVYAAFVAWDQLPGARRIGEGFRSAAARLARTAPLVVAAAGAVYFAMHETAGSPISTSRGWSETARWLYWLVPALVALYHLAREARRYARAVRSRPHQASATTPSAASAPVDGSGIE